MKKLFVFGVVVSLLICIVAVVFFNSNYYYSKRLITAIQEQNMTKIQQILQKKPECINTYPSITPKWWHSAMNWRVMFPLTEACCTDNIELIKLLIESGADVNCNDGLTPLSVTYGGKRENWYAISQLLIQNGATLDYTTEYSAGKSCVLQNIVQRRGGASLPGYVPESDDEVLLAFDYAINNCDHSKIEWMRVLQHSVMNDRIEIVTFLLDENYCSVDDDSVGMTALMFAARDSTPEMVQLLLDYGADKYHKDPNGKTAYDYAVDFGESGVAELLKN